MEENLYINYNGNFFQKNEPVLLVNNRAFRYGDGLFDTIRVVDGHPSFLNRHLSRLQDGMIFLKMKIHPLLNEINFENEIIKTLEKNGIKDGGRIRISVFRNAGGLYAPETHDVSFIIESSPLENNYYEINKKGLNIDVFDEQKKPLNKISTIKTSCCLPLVLAGIFKKEKNLDDCIIINEMGSISEATSSNIFIVYNGVFYTPSLNQGCIPGIMRQVIIEMLRRGGTEVQECPLSPSALLRADEVFFTNVIKGVQWVGSYKQKRYFSNVSKNLVEKLNARIKEPLPVQTFRVGN